MHETSASQLLSVKRNAIRATRVVDALWDCVHDFFVFVFRLCEGGCSAVCGASSERDLSVLTLT